MENLDVMVLRTLRDWRAAGQRALLATVVRTWGSSPRPIGSIMALSESGAVVGSVSGGCIEDDLIYRFTQAYAQGNAGQGEDKHIPSGAPGFVKYGISADEAHRFGLPCGGTLELLLEYDPDAASLAQLVTALEAGQLMQRTVRLSDGAVTLAEALAPKAARGAATQAMEKVATPGKTAIEIMLKQVAHLQRTGKLEGVEMPDDAMDSFVGP